MRDKPLTTITASLQKQEIAVAVTRSQTCVTCRCHADQQRPPPSCLASATMETQRLVPAPIQGAPSSPYLAIHQASRQWHEHPSAGRRPQWVAFRWLSQRRKDSHRHAWLVTVAPVDTDRCQPTETSPLQIAYKGKPTTLPSAHNGRNSQTFRHPTRLVVTRCRYHRARPSPPSF